MATDVRTFVYKALLHGLYATGAYRLARPAYAGVGGILTFHRVVEPSAGFSPNAALAVTPAFFEAVITHLMEGGWSIVTMTELCRHIRSGSRADRLVALSFDDGYRDNFDNAFAICQRHKVPMTVNVTTGFINGTSFPWWYALEELLRRRNRVAVTTPEGVLTLSAGTSAQKAHAFRRLADRFDHAGNAEALRLLDDLELRNGVDLRSHCRGLMMSWDMVREMAASPYGEIGAHTETHPALRTLDAATAEAELRESRAVLAAMLGRPVDHVAFPFGGRQAVGGRELDLAAKLGFATAVTTRHGTLQREHRDHLCALPRLTVNGLHQSLGTIDVFLSGSSTALANRFRRVVTQ